MRQVFGDIVVVKHADTERPADLAVRLAAAMTPELRLLFAAPLTATELTAPDGRALSLYPATDPLGPDEPPPWRAAGALLARLHQTEVPEEFELEHAGFARLQADADAATIGHQGGATDILRELGQTLLETWPTPTTVAMVHGGWNLSTIGRLPHNQAWVLTDPTHLGVGDPAWDLGGPAGMWGAGLLDDASWRQFLAGYADAGGEVPRQGPWTALDHPARCAVFSAAVRAVAASGREELSPTGKALIRACVRINGRRW